MRVAHLIMAHKNPAQLVKLVERLLHPNIDIYLHIDAKVGIDQFETLRKIPDLLFIKNRSTCNWGGYSLLKGIVQCVEEILQSDRKYDFINMISGQDYPIQSAECIYNFLVEKKGNIFISFEESHESDWWKKASNRYEKYHLTDYKIRGRYFIERLINMIMPKRRFPGNMTLYGGNKSCWWTLSRDSAAYIVSKVNNSPELTNFLKLCWGTDEFVIPTLIMNSYLKEKVINDNLRFIDWSEGNAHPKILRNSDFEEIRNSKMLFARKFDMEIDQEILEKIDDLLLQKKC